MNKIKALAAIDQNIEQGKTYNHGIFSIKGPLHFAETEVICPRSPTEHASRDKKERICECVGPHLLGGGAD